MGIKNKQQTRKKSTNKANALKEFSSSSKNIIGSEIDNVLTHVRLFYKVFTVYS